MDSTRCFHRLKLLSIRKICGSAHFHYDNVELGPVRVKVEEPTIFNDSVDISQCHAYSTKGQKIDQKGNLSVQEPLLRVTFSVSSNDQHWLIKRTLKEACQFDKQLHRCVFDRRYSKLEELIFDDYEEQNADQNYLVISLLSNYFKRFSDLAGSLITCYPVLKWLELDNRGNHLFAAEETLINTPAVASAFAVRDYSAQTNSEISLSTGDIVSVIDMPPSSESFWWRGKLTIGKRSLRGSLEDEFQSPVSCKVGFFPSECVQLFGNRIHSLPDALNSSECDKAVFRKRHNFVYFFRDFLLTRPPRRRLKESGILLERVFGCDLAEHLQNTGLEIPAVLKFCCHFIESRGIVDGIYRLSGAVSNIQKLRYIFDEKKEPRIDDESLLRDVHSVASVLKMYFRELPNPLFTYQLNTSFVEAIDVRDNSSIVLRLHSIVQQLPPPYFRTAERLIKHLAKVGELSVKTGMTFQNLSIVWAPNLLRSSELESAMDDCGSLLRNVNVQAVVVEYLIRYADIIFSRKLPQFTSNTPFPNSSCLSLSSGEKRFIKIEGVSSSPQKLIDLEEAQRRLKATKLQELSPQLTLSYLSDRKCVNVNGGPDKLPAKYHTILNVPSRWNSSLQKSNKWRSVFGNKNLSAALVRTFPSMRDKRKYTLESSSKPIIVVSQKLNDKAHRRTSSFNNLRTLSSTSSRGSSFRQNSSARRNLGRQSLRDSSCSKKISTLVQQVDCATVQDKKEQKEKWSLEKKPIYLETDLDKHLTQNVVLSGEAAPKISFRSDFRKPRTLRQRRNAARASYEEFHCGHEPCTISVHVNLAHPTVCVDRLPCSSSSQIQTSDQVKSKLTSVTLLPSSLCVSQNLVRYSAPPEASTSREVFAGSSLTSAHCCPTAERSYSTSASSLSFSPTGDNAPMASDGLAMTSSDENFQFVDSKDYARILQKMNGENTTNLGQNFGVQSQSSTSTVCSSADLYYADSGSTRDFSPFAYALYPGWHSCTPVMSSGSKLDSKFDRTSSIPSPHWLSTKNLSENCSKECDKRLLYPDFASSGSKSCVVRSRPASIVENQSNDFAKDCSVVRNVNRTSVCSSCSSDRSSFKGKKVAKVLPLTDAPLMQSREDSPSVENNKVDAVCNRFLGSSAQVDRTSSRETAIFKQFERSSRRTDIYGSEATLIPSKSQVETALSADSVEKSVDDEVETLISSLTDLTLLPGRFVARSKNDNDQSRSGPALISANPYHNSSVDMRAEAASLIGNNFKPNSVKYHMNTFERVDEVLKSIDRDLNSIERNFVESSGGGPKADFSWESDDEEHLASLYENVQHDSSTSGECAKNRSVSKSDLKRLVEIQKPNQNTSSAASAVDNDSSSMKIAQANEAYDAIADTSGNKSVTCAPNVAGKAPHLSNANHSHLTSSTPNNTLMSNWKQSDVILRPHTAPVVSQRVENTRKSCSPYPFRVAGANQPRITDLKSDLKRSVVGSFFNGELSFSPLYIKQQMALTPAMRSMSVPDSEDCSGSGSRPAGTNIKEDNRLFFV